MSSRPHIRSTIVELEELFAAKPADTDTLNALKTELQFRNLPRAAALLAKVKAVLAGGATLTPTAQSGLFAVPLSTKPSPPEPTSVILPKPTPKSIDKLAELPAIAIDEAYKLLQATAKTSWDEIEQARANLVQRSHPDVLAGLSADKWAAALRDAKLANAAYGALAQERKRGS